MLLLPGDLTDTGLVEEAEVLLDELAEFPIPIVAVLGDHDHESDHAEEIATMLKDAGIRALDGSVCEIDGVGFVGTKGFAGGFDDRIVQPVGERAGPPRRRRRRPRPRPLRIAGGGDARRSRGLQRQPVRPRPARPAAVPGLRGVKRR